MRLIDNKFQFFIYSKSDKNDKKKYSSSYFTSFFFFNYANFSYNNNLFFHDKFIKNSDNFSGLNKFTAYCNYAQNFSNKENFDQSAFSSLYWNKDPIFNQYLYFKNSSFITFFTNLAIDVPVCLTNVKSLRRKNFELPIFKFFSLIFRNGKKLKIIKKLLFSKFITFQNDKKNQLITSIRDWKLFFCSINSLFFNTLKGDQTHYLFNLNSVDTRNNKLPVNNKLFFKNYFFNLINQIKPVFFYFVYSVDKNVRKYSRGKSGKYTFVWKYVPVYKRIHVAMRLIAREIKFRYEKTIAERFNSVFFLLENNLETTLLWKSKNFAHNYAFKNLKKSLMVNLRTIVNKNTN